MIDKEIINTDKSADNSDVKEDRETTPPWLVEEIQIEELAVDGICGIY
ncbi:variant-type mycofactocin precursor [Desulfococcaceae bacterium HSG9]|nr:variant-type mycofactocin precursor [Desulfococcaceae bacterium HSG9]